MSAGVDDLLQIYAVSSCLNEIINRIEENERIISQKSKETLSVLEIFSECDNTFTVFDYSTFFDENSSENNDNENVDEPPTFESMEFFTDLLNVAPTQMALTQFWGPPPQSQILTIDAEETKSDGEETENVTVVANETEKIVTENENEEKIISERFVPEISTFVDEERAKESQKDSKEKSKILVGSNSATENDENFPVFEYSSPILDEKKRCGIVVWLNKATCPQFSLPQAMQSTENFVVPLKYAKDKKFRVGLSKKQFLKRLHSATR